MDTNVVSLPKPEPKPETHQLVLEGFPEPTGLYFSLTSAKNLPTDKPKGWQEHVSGRFEGTVMGTSFVERHGELVQVLNISVTEAELD